MPDSATLTVIFQGDGAGGSPPSAAASGAGAPPAPPRADAETPAGGEPPQSTALVPLSNRGGLSVPPPGGALATQSAGESSAMVVASQAAVDRLTYILTGLGQIYQLMQRMYEHAGIEERRDREDLPATSPGESPKAAESSVDDRNKALAKSLAFSTAVIGTLNSAAGVINQYQNAITSSQARALLDRNAIAEQAANTRAGGQAAGGGLKVAAGAGIAVAGGLAASGVGLPVAGVVVAGSALVYAIGSLAETVSGAAADAKDRFVQIDAAFRARAQQLGAYNPTLASANAAMDLSKLRADIIESRYFGADLSRLSGRQVELDRLQRATKALDEREQIKSQLDQTQAQINRLNADLNKRLANVDRNTREMVDALRRGDGRTPMQDFLDGMKLPDDQRPQRADNALDARALADINRPILGHGGRR